MKREQYSSGDEGGGTERIRDLSLSSVLGGTDKKAFGEA